MADDITKTESEKFADLAHFNFNKLIETKVDLEKRFLDMGFLLGQFRDYSLYKFLNYDTLEAMLGAPELGIKRSTAYDLMRVFDLYCKKLQIAQEDLADCGKTKLLKMAKVVEDNPDKALEWIDKAKSLSVSCLKEEVAVELGLPSVPPKPIPVAATSSDSLSCCVCGKSPVDKHHFPVGRQSSSDEKGDWTIPLCRECHSSYHAEPKEWTWTYRKNWMRYLVNRKHEE